MSFTAKRQANLLLYQQETIINRKYILFQGGVNVFLIARYILSRERWISPLTTPSRYFPPPNPIKTKRNICSRIFCSWLYAFAIRETRSPQTDVAICPDFQTAR